MNSIGDASTRTRSARRLRARGAGVDAVAARSGIDALADGTSGVVRAARARVHAHAIDKAGARKLLERGVIARRALRLVPRPAPSHSKP